MANIETVAVVPDAAKRQAEEGDRALEAFLKAQGGAADSGQPGEKPGVLGTLDEGGQPTASTPADQPSETEVLRRELQAAQQKNASLMGRLESQLRPLNEVLRQQKVELDRLTRQNEELRQTPAVPQAPVHERDLSDADRAAVPEDARKTSAKIAHAVVAEELQNAKRELEAQLQATTARLEQLERAASTATTTTFFDAVDKLIPGARELNESGDEQWVAFLDESDPFSGKTRRVLAEAAIGAGDVRRVADIVGEYYERIGKAVPARVASQVRPVSRGDSAPRRDQRKPQIRKSTMDAFYSDVARGKYVGREDEAKRIEAEIDAAVMENRIVPG